MLYISNYSSGGGSGTVTNIATGTGLTGGPITSTGTIALSTALAPMATLTGNALKVLRVNAGETAVEYATISGTGTVTNVSSANSDISVANPTSTPTLTLNSDTAATASTIVKRDASINIYSNNYFPNTTSTASSGGTTVLTIASSRVQRITGSSNHTFQLPNATTLPTSSIFEFDNNSSGTVTINNNGGVAQYTLSNGGDILAKCTDNSTANGVWDFHALAPTIVSWSSGVSGLQMNNALNTTPLIQSGASSSTSPSFIPQRVASTTGFGGDGTNLYATIGGVATVTVSSTNVTVPAINRVTITAPATSATLTIANGKTLTANNSITLTGTDSTTMTFPSTSKTIAANDGTNFAVASQATGDLIVATSGTAVGRLADVAVGQVLVSGGVGVAPAYSATPLVTSIDIGNADTTITRTGAGAIAVEGVGVALNSTSLAHTASQYEVGNASDTTITRAAAGVIAVEGTTINGYATTATAAGTTTLTIASAQTQFFTGTSTQTVTLPTTSVLAGQTYKIENNSTGNVTVQSSGANTIQILGAGMTGVFTALVATPTTAANWDRVLYEYQTLNLATTATANAATINLAAKTNSITNNSAATLTITLPTAGAIDGEMRIVRVYDFSAVAQTITWVNTQNSTVTAPTTSNGSTTLPLTVGFQFNSASSLWRCIASA